MSMKIAPGSPYFAAQKEVRERLTYALNRSNAVLLYGGRQAGKTALLRFVSDEQSETLGNVEELSSCELFIYTDLTRLPYDATPSNFYQLLFTRALVACKSRVVGFEYCLLQAPGDLDGFVTALQSLSAACHQFDVRFVFLLDEAKRVLGSRFPRGFQDNLFSLLFGEAGDQLKIAMVFSGNQHLNEFLKDDTSPIGSRSLSVHLSTIARESLQRLVSMMLQEVGVDGDSVGISASLISITGGHAGLTARLLESTLSDHASLDPNLWVSELAGNSEALFENWILSMSPEARDFTSFFVRTKRISIQALAGWLESKGLNKFFARRVFDEYEYSGIAKRCGDELKALNPLFWDYVAVVTSDEVNSARQENVWSVIEETELSLRQLILDKFKAKFGDTSHNRMKAILGDKTWEQITSIQAKSHLIRNLPQLAHSVSL